MSSGVEWESIERDWLKEQIHLKADIDIGELEGVGLVWNEGLV